MFLWANDELRVNIVVSQEKTSKGPVKLGDLAFADVLNRTWMLTQTLFSEPRLSLELSCSQIQMSAQHQDVRLVPL